MFTYYKFTIGSKKNGDEKNFVSLGEKKIIEILRTIYEQRNTGRIFEKRATGWPRKKLHV